MYIQMSYHNKFYLHNLAAMCAGLKREEWPDIVFNHFNSLSQGEIDKASLDKTNWEAIKPILRIRLYVYSEDSQDSLAGMVNRIWPPGIAAVLVYDLPSMVVGVGKHDPIAWGKSEDELFAVVKENYLAAGMLCQARRDDPSGFSTWYGDEDLAGWFAMTLKQHLTPEARHGAIVALSTRTTAFQRTFVFPRFLRAEPAQQGSFL